MRRKLCQEAATQAVKNIRRERRRFSAEDKIRIVLEGLRGEDSIAESAVARGLSRTSTAGRKTFSRPGRSDWLAIRPGPRPRTRSRTCGARPAR